MSDAQELPQDACAVLVNGLENKEGTIWVISKIEGTISLRAEGSIIVLGPSNGGLAFWGLSRVRYFRR